MAPVATRDRTRKIGWVLRIAVARPHNSHVLDVKAESVQEDRDLSFVIAHPWL
jgi:hypothetical protein